MKKYDMAFSKAEQKKFSSPKASAAPITNDKYPYGLEISLVQESLDKLGIDKLPSVGKKIRIEAMCEVTRVSSSQHLDSKDRSVGLQIVSMGYENAPQTALEAVEDGVEEGS